MAEPELNLDVDDDGCVTGEVRIVQTCAECGTELAEANREVETEVVLEHTPDCKKENGLELDNEEAENDDRYEGSGRYSKHFYVVNVHGVVRCPDCGAEQEFDASTEEQASSFEPLV
jgi:hypothetical protein